MSQRVRITFRYRKGDVVWWEDDPTRPLEAYVVVQRRWTDRDILAPVIEYGLSRLAEPTGRMWWAYEPDVLATEEEPP